jgi:nucleolar protein 56
VKDSKKAKFQLGVAEPKLGSAIQEATSVPCVCNEFIGELLRGIRAHFTRFIDNLKDEGELGAMADAVAWLACGDGHT